jgi:hypothetical protein
MQTTYTQTFDPVVEEYPTHFFIHWSFDGATFSEVFASVSRLSVLLLGAPKEDAGLADGPVTDCLIGVLRLPAPIAPDETGASLDGNSLVLKLEKA